MDKRHRKGKDHPRFLSLDGQRFGRLTVKNSDLSKSRVRVLCDCGREFETSKSSLTTGNTTSCGKGLCHPGAKDLTGQKFGYLTIVGLNGPGKWGHLWECLCVCGKKVNVGSKQLIQGQTKSCGCKRALLYSQKTTLPDNQGEVNAILKQYRSHAKKLGVGFLLNKGEFRTLLQSACHYCGATQTNSKKVKSLVRQNKEFKYNGIDRIDSYSGYTSDNCVACCHQCNYAKRKLSYGAFLSLTKKIAARFTLDTRANEILDSGNRVYVAATGSGAGLTGLLWDVPGISKVLVGTVFPYAPEATDQFLGFQPDSYCSERTAIALALEAYLRAFQPEGAPAVGLGLTGSVASTTAHRGDHRVYVATVTDHGCWVYSTTLVKGSGSEARKRDGDISDTLGLAALLEATGQADTTNIGPSLLSFEKKECSQEALEVLLTHPLWTPSGKRLKAPTNGNGLALFPGAFNPPHDGHFWMAKEHQAIFHITINPPHKPALTAAQMLQRAKMLEGFPRLFTQDDPLYLDKARRFPGAKILVGVDAVERMLDPKWGVEIAPMLEEFRRLGIKFLVADREFDGKVITLDDIKDAPKDLCERILRPAQHLTMSSTKVREAQTRCV